VAVPAQPRAGTPVSYRYGWPGWCGPSPAQLQALALTGKSLEIPADAQARFLAEYFPVLRQRADIISSDDSFTHCPAATGGARLLR